MERIMCYRPLPTREGLVLAGVLIVGRNPDGTLAIEGNEARIMALLQAAYGRPVTADEWNTIGYISELMGRYSDEVLEDAVADFLQFTERKNKDRYNA